MEFINLFLPINSDRFSVGLWSVGRNFSWKLLYKHWW